MKYLREEVGIIKKISYIFFTKYYIIFMSFIFIFMIKKTNGVPPVKNQMQGFIGIPK